MREFKLEDYLAQHEFTAKYLMCCSDAETFRLQEIIAMASPNLQEMWNTLDLGYTQAPGHPILRQEIAQSLYQNVGPDNIFCFAGAEEGIFSSLSALCESGDHVLVLTPCYQSLYEIPRMNGCDITCLELREENDWRIDLEEIQKAITSRTKGILLNFPHNPTGQVISESETRGLVEICEAHNLWVFADEVYRLLGQPQEGWSEPLAAVYPRAISLGVMSKAFGMAGLRVGWIACQDRKLIEQIHKFKNYLSICNSAPAEIISLITLQNKETILKRNNEIVATNLARLDNFFEIHGNLFTWVRPQGGCVGFVRYHGPMTIEDFTQALLKKQEFFLYPAKYLTMMGLIFASVLDGKICQKS